MINRILVELYDEYAENNNIEGLIEFTKKTLPNDGTDKLFIGCVLIMFSIAGIYKPRYFCTRENLVSIVLLAKEKVGSSNLLAFYIDRVNETKGINKYLIDVVNDPKLDEHANVIIEYLDQFKLDFVSKIKSHGSLDDYIKSVGEKLNKDKLQNEVPLRQDVIKAHILCSKNKEHLEKVDVCGCFYCLKIFNPKLITDWCDGGKTAICPFCGIDSIIYENKYYPVTENFLEAMKKEWF